MKKIIYFKNEDQKKDNCSGRVYKDFLDYAFEKTDYFMLVYVNYNNKGFTPEMKYFQKKLVPYKVKSRTNPSWPGTLSCFSPNTTYRISFYRNASEAKEILKTVDGVYSWTRPNYPQDLAFFKGNQCWFYSVGHENIAAILHADYEDIVFLQSRGLADGEKAFIPSDNYYDAYDEKLE